jgi:2'-5' RNA ligase
MARTVVIDELHVTIRVPSDLSEVQADEVHRALTGEEFMNRLRRAVRAALRAFPELAVARVSLTR